MLSGHKNLLIVSFNAKMLQKRSRPVYYLYGNTLRREG
jgi:hypothetical protein